MTTIGNNPMEIFQNTSFKKIGDLNTNNRLGTDHFYSGSLKYNQNKSE